MAGSIRSGCEKFSAPFRWKGEKYCQNHRLNMELDLRTLFGLHVHCTLYTTLFIGWDPATLPSRRHIWAHIRGHYWSAKIDYISCEPLAKTYNLNFLWRHSPKSILYSPAYESLTHFSCFEESENSHVTKIPLTQIIYFTSIERSRRDFPVGLTGIFYSVLKKT